jgi:hypothetical protein
MPSTKTRVEEDSMEPAKGVYGQQVAVQKCRLVEAGGSSSPGWFMQLVECAGLLTSDGVIIALKETNGPACAKPLADGIYCKGLGGVFLRANVVRNSTKGEVET